MSYHTISKGPPAEKLRRCTRHNCIYRAGKGSTSHCNYCFIKGTSRLAAHRGESDQPADCKLFVPHARGSRRCTKYDWETARQMLASGVYSQKDIASRLGIPTQQLTNFVYREKKKKEKHHD